MEEPKIHLPENALDPDGGYTVELGPHRFSQAQWESIVLYAEGYANAREIEEATTVPGHRAQQQNAEFHAAMGIETWPVPRAIPAEDVPVVIELIREEFIDELIPALGARVRFTPAGQMDVISVQPGEANVVEIYDALIDILYVVYGALNRAGMNAAPGYDEVQASNMSKLDADGNPIIAGPNDPDGVFPGRVKKGPNYFKPMLGRILAEQGYRTPSTEGYDDHQDH